MDYLLLAFGILNSILYMHAESPAGGIYPGSITESMRRLFLFIFAIFVPYFAMSRSVRTREQLVDVMATFCLNCALLCGDRGFRKCSSLVAFCGTCGALGR